MKGTATKVLSSTLLVILILAVAADAALLFSSPIWLNALYRGESFGFGRIWIALDILMPSGSQTFIQIFVALSGLMLGGILFEAIRLLMSVRKGNPFCMGNARSLKRAAWFSLAQMVLFIAKMFDAPTPLTLGCAGIFLIAALLFFVLADVFRAAALLREDNDLTI